MVDAPLLLGDRYVARSNLDNAAVEALPAAVQEISEIVSAIDRTGK